MDVLLKVTRMKLESELDSKCKDNDRKLIKFMAKQKIEIDIKISESTKRLADEVDKDQTILLMLKIFAEFAEELDFLKNKHKNEIQRMNQTIVSLVKRELGDTNTKKCTLENFQSEPDYLRNFSRLSVDQCFKILNERKYEMLDSARHDLVTKLETSGWIISDKFIYEDITKIGALLDWMEDYKNKNTIPPKDPIDFYIKYLPSNIQNLWKNPISKDTDFKSFSILFKVCTSIIKSPRTLIQFQLWSKQRCAPELKLDFFTSQNFLTLSDDYKFMYTSEVKSQCFAQPMDGKDLLIKLNERYHRGSEITDENVQVDDKFKGNLKLGIYDQDIGDDLKWGLLIKNNIKKEIENEEPNNLPVKKQKLEL